MHSALAIFARASAMAMGSVQSVLVIQCAIVNPATMANNVNLMTIGRSPCQCHVIISCAIMVAFVT